MKRYLVVFAILALFAGALYAADTSSVSPHGTIGLGVPDRYQAAIPLLGKTPRTTQVTVDNTARTIDNLVVTASGTYLGGSDNTLTPIAVTGSCTDNITRWSFQTTPSATVGHQISVGGSFQFSGPDAIGYLRGKSESGGNAPCALTLWY